MDATMTTRDEIMKLVRSMNTEQLLKALKIVEEVYQEELRTGRHQKPQEPAPPQT